MKFTRFAFSAVLCALVSAAMAAPAVLIVQMKLPIKDKLDPNVDISEAIGKEYDANGRLVPIVYSSADPIVKAALSTGELKGIYENPRSNEMLDAARKLHVNYVIVVSAYRSGPKIESKLLVYKDRHEVWKDEQNMSVSLQEIVDPANTVASLAHTLCVRMDLNVFKGLQDRPKANNPTLQPGQQPTVVPTMIQLTPEVNSAELNHDVDELVKSGKSSQAILKLRDSVDLAPFDFERRKALILLLGDTSAENAALEARRASAVMPEKVELRVLAARYWIKAGHSDEAQRDLNEAIARDPNGAATRLMLGEVSLSQMEPSKALPHLDEAIKQKDEAEPRFLRAICRALLGGTDGMQLDLAQAAKMSPTKADSVALKRYDFAANLMDRSLAIDGTELKSLIPKLVVKPKDQGLHEDLDQMLRLVQSRTAFLTAVEPPATGKIPHDQRLLAYRLMAQSILDVQTYCTSKDEDTLADARINLGESMKQLAAARGPAPATKN